jgi:uncharacterized protein (TIGR02646 family)
VRSIRKGLEPRSLVQHRASAHSSYDNFADKDVLRASLLAEQGGLCCYCLSRITVGKMKIEHWHSQRHYESEQLDYSNLLGACMGNEGQRPESQHCDTRKRDRSLSRSPANGNHRVDALVRFLPDGRVASDDVNFDVELNDVLNLNFSRLKENRKEVLRGFLEGLSKSGELQRAELEKLLQEWNGISHAGELRPFCQVVVYWIRKRLARL